MVARADSRGYGLARLVTIASRDVRPLSRRGDTERRLSAPTAHRAGYARSSAARPAAVSE